MISFTVAGKRIEYLDGEWGGDKDAAEIVAALYRLYIAMPHGYTPTPLEDFVVWLGKYLPVSDVDMPEVSADEGVVY